MVSEGRTAHVVQNRITIERGKTTGSIGHKALTLGAANRLAQVGLGVEAIFARPAFRRVKRDHVIALLERSHIRAHIHNNARTFVAQNRGEQPLWIGTGQSKFICVTNASSLNFNHNLTGPWARQVYFHHFQGLARLGRYRSTRTHNPTLRSLLIRPDTRPAKQPNAMRNRLLRGN